MSVRLDLVTRPEDLESIAKMDADIFGNDVDPRISETMWWIARVNGDIAAYCGCRYVEYPDSKYLYLSRAGVLEDYRGLGLQRKMIRKRIKYGRDTGCEWAVTDTAPWNWASANNLFREGFLLYDPEEHWAAEHALYFRKRLLSA